MDLNSLKHTKKELSNGGIVLALNTGAVIGPEAEAMLQALHSRSIGGINSHLEVLAKRGPENFMANFYVGYGHKSIGDCGTVTIFIEGVSMLAAKAIQDWPLYSGQEASTRYIDFANQSFVDPKNTKQSKEILEKWRAFYIKGLGRLIEELPKRFPRGENEDEKVYTKAIKARAFDIMRSFLPSGATTNLAWHTNLRQAADHIMRLRHHTLKEVCDIAEKLEELLLEVFPSSFGHKRYETTEKFNKEWMQRGYYYTNKKTPNFSMTRNSVDKKTLSKYKKILANRPAKVEIPKEVAEAGQVQFEFLLDFGSFRDIQRHRSVIQRMPLVTTDHGFGEWYLGELPKDLVKEATSLLKSQKTNIKRLKLEKTEEQYYIPMGYKLPNKLIGSIPHVVYLSELRCTRFVHPTLRSVAIKIAEALRRRFKNEGLVIHMDKDHDRFDVNRGRHDIVAKN